MFHVVWRAWKLLLCSVFALHKVMTDKKSQAVVTVSDRNTMNPLLARDKQSLEFTITRIFMKIVRTGSAEVVKNC